MVQNGDFFCFLKPYEDLSVPLKHPSVTPMYCSYYLYHKINFTSPNEESLLWPSASINSVNSESSCNRNIYICGQYVYQIPIPYSLQKGGHNEHLCLWLILIGRA